MTAGSAGACEDPVQDLDVQDPEASESARADLLLRSVGTATPRAISILVGALGLPREFVVDAIYRAPARLIANLARPTAERLAGMLGDLGLDAAAVAAGRLPARGPVFDVALVLTDPTRAEEVSAALGRFLGTSTQAALDAMLTPPGIVLGNVTAPTVAALRAALHPACATLTVSNPDVARYALFAPRLTAAQQAALRPLLPSGVGAGDDGSLSCFELSRLAADTAWRRLRASADVRIVNQDFLRFTLVLASVPDDARAGADALQALADVPVDAYPDLVAVLPCPLVEGVHYRDLGARMAAFSAAGFGLRAELETFTLQALEIRTASAAALAAAGLSGALPLVTAPMPLARARVTRARLEALGAEVLPA